MTLVTIEEFLNKFKLDDAIHLANYMNNAHYLYVTWWIQKKEVFEELHPLTKKLIRSSIKSPIFELKPLLEDIKYVFLEPK